MNKPAYVSLICGACDLNFAIRKKDYDKSHAYNCPMCMSANIITPQDLKPVKPFRRQPVIAEKE